MQAAPKKTIYAVFPYISKNSNKSLNSEISVLCKRFYPQLNVKIIFKNQFSVSSFFNFKDKVSTLVQSNLVYQYSCGQCDATYIGETSRHLKTRIAEHKGLSNRTGNPLLNPPHSSIRDHALNSGHEIPTDNFKIIFKSKPFETKIAESILIHKYKPSLNNMESSVKLNVLD